MTALHFFQQDDSTRRPPPALYPPWQELFLPRTASLLIPQIHYVKRVAMGMGPTFTCLFIGYVEHCLFQCFPDYLSN